ncbi:hypothetical protein Tsp_09656, partial [Trichinella spiralis]|uniref:hypothetical protein n=1 Tax=Trichinella spiralis TaxID=6334 RepID=UPI0001EFF05F
MDRIDQYKRKANSLRSAKELQSRITSINKIAYTKRRKLKSWVFPQQTSGTKGTESETFPG